MYSVLAQVPLQQYLLRFLCHVHSRGIGYVIILHTDNSLWNNKQRPVSIAFQKTIKHWLVITNF